MSSRSTGSSRQLGWFAGEDRARGGWAQPARGPGNFSRSREAAEPEGKRRAFKKTARVALTACEKTITFRAVGL